MGTFRSQLITTAYKRNKINRVNKHHIEIHLEFVPHYITLTNNYIVMGRFTLEIITAT